MEPAGVLEAWLEVERGHVAQLERWIHEGEERLCQLVELIAAAQNDAGRLSRLALSPKQEPDAVVLHVRICAGGRPQRRFLPRH